MGKRGRPTSSRSLYTLNSYSTRRDEGYMLKRLSIYGILFLGFVLSISPSRTLAQLGNSGSIEGVVKDASGGVIAGARVEIANPVSRFSREATTDTNGSFR